MFNIGFTEMLVIAIVALIFIGPKQLPEVARTIGQFLNEMKRGAGSFKDQFSANMDFESDEKSNDNKNSNEKNETLS